MAGSLNKNYSHHHFDELSGGSDGPENRLPKLKPSLHMVEQSSIRQRPDGGNEKREKVVFDVVELSK